MPDKATQSGEGGSSRWWEFYAVRYAMGTVVGAVVFYFVCSANPVLRPLLLGIEVGDKAESVKGASLSVKLTFLAIYGLIYCYIASAPILVFHATRFLLDLDVSFGVWLRRCLRYVIAPVVGGIIIYFETGRLAPGQRWFYAAMGSMVGFIVWLQYWAVPLTLCRRKELYAFYDRLARNRKGAVGGITESYRHLREHGNSFFIVWLEILLGVVLFGIGSHLPANIPNTDAMLLYVCVLLVWIFPAVLVWLIATVFERKFAGAD